MQLSNKNKDIPALTSLRFFAALSVFTAHSFVMLMNTGPYVPSSLYCPSTRLSAIGMTLFFVLSGFVIHYNYSESIKNNPAKGVYNFFVARFARLYPLFFVCLTYELFGDSFYKYSQDINFYQTILYFYTLTFSWIYLVIGKNSLIYQFGVISSVGWSISTEWFFYLIYPIICYIILKSSKLYLKFFLLLITLTIGIGSVIFIAFHANEINNYGAKMFGPIADLSNGNQDSFYRWVIYFSPYSRIIEFILGCVTASIYMQLKNSPPTPKEEIYGIFLTLFAFTTLYFAYQCIFNAPPAMSWLIRFHQNFGFAPSVALLIFCCTRYKNFITKWLGNRFTIWGGEISYSMYLLHIPVITFVRKFNNPIASYSDTLYTFFLIVSAFAILLILSNLTYNSIELPAQRFFKRALSLKKPVGRYPMQET